MAERVKATSDAWFERRARSRCSFAVCQSRTDSPMRRISGGSSSTTYSFTPTMIFSRFSTAR
jgi:hypothetical protein